MRQKAVIIDIDGTLANSPQPSEEHLVNGNMCWDTWIASTQYAPVHIWCYELVAAMANLGYRIVYLTARSDGEYSRGITERWLKQNSPVPDFDLFMRNVGDLRHDQEQKRDALIKEILPLYDVIFAIDDKKVNVDMFREFGIPSLHCADY